MGLIILPSRPPAFIGGKKVWEPGEGLDRDGPPSDSQREFYCKCKYHDEAVPRRFDGPPNAVPTVCPHCIRAIKERLEKEKAAGTHDGNSQFSVARVTRGAPPVSGA